MLIIVNYIGKPWRWFSFGVDMRSGFFILFFLCSLNIFAQERSLDGIVFDRSSKDRIAEVNIINMATGKSIYNNLKGEFIINAHIGDKLIFTKLNYHPDTVKVQSFTSLAIYMQPLSIQLKEITIHDSTLTPEQQLLATKSEFGKAYGPLANRNMLSIAPEGGVGLSIDALYNSISRSGRNAAHLRDNIQNDYYQNAIDYRFNKTLVGKITGLKDARLTEFMQLYRPGYYTVESASDYEFIIYIKANFRRYLRRTRAYTLPPLVN